MLGILFGRHMALYRNIKSNAEAIDTLLSNKETAQKYANSAHQRVEAIFQIPKC